MEKIDHLPDVEHTFEFCAALAELLVPEPPGYWEILPAYRDTVTLDQLLKEVDRDL